MNVENSTLDAWAVLNLWGTGNSVYNFRNSTLIGRNYYPAGPSNDFANFVINQGAENAVINIEDSQLIMFSKTTNKQYAVSARTTATIPINITGNTKIVDRTNSLDYVISKNNNTGVVFSIAPTVSVIGKQGASLEEN